MFEFPWVRTKRLKREADERMSTEYAEAQKRLAALSASITDEIDLRAFCEPGDRFDVLGITYLCAYVCDGRIHAVSNGNGRLDLTRFERQDLTALYAERTRAVERQRDLAASADLLRSAGYLVVADGLEVVGQ
jgi:hypothetical protein